MPIFLESSVHLQNVRKADIRILSYATYGSKTNQLEDTLSSCE